MGRREREMPLVMMAVGRWANRPTSQPGFAEEEEKEKKKKKKKKKREEASSAKEDSWNGGT